MCEPWTSSLLWLRRMNNPRVTNTSSVASSPSPLFRSPENGNHNNEPSTRQTNNQLPPFHHPPPPAPKTSSKCYDIANVWTRRFIFERAWERPNLEGGKTLLEGREQQVTALLQRLCACWATSWLLPPPASPGLA